MNSPSHSSKIVKVAAAIIQKDGKYLITRRHKHSHLGHLWEFPGGKLETDETPELCIVRECKEEIDLEIKPLSLFKEVIHSYPEVKLHLYFLLCEIVSGTPRAIDCAGIEWVFPSELINYEFPEADIQIINELMLTHTLA